MASTIRVAIYCRVSTSHHDQKPEIQINALRSYCDSRNWLITEEVVDHGFSGSTDNRPGLKRLLSLVRQRQVDAVVVLKLDRLFRSLKHLLTVLDEFNSLGITFVAVRDQIDYSTAAGRLFISILGSLSEFERELIRERTIMGLEHAKSKGKHLGRPVKHSKEEITRLRNSGLSYRQIRASIGAPIGTIARVLNSARKSSGNLGTKG